VSGEEVRAGLGADGVASMWISTAAFSAGLATRHRSCTPVLLGGASARARGRHLYGAGADDLHSRAESEWTWSR